MKIIKVSGCINCPFRNVTELKSGGYDCRCDKSKRNIIMKASFDELVFTLNETPNWCELMDEHEYNNPPLSHF